MCPWKPPSFTFSTCSIHKRKATQREEGWLVYLQAAWRVIWENEEGKPSGSLQKRRILWEGGPPSSGTSKGWSSPLSLTCQMAKEDRWRSIGSLKWCRKRGPWPFLVLVLKRWNPTYCFKAINTTGRKGVARGSEAEWVHWGRPVEGFQERKLYPWSETNHCMMIQHIPLKNYYRKIF